MVLRSTSLAAIVLAAATMAGCATYRDPSAPRTMSLASCTPSQASLQRVLRHGPVEGSYTYAQNGALPQGGPDWLRTPDRHFMYVRATLNPTAEDIQDGGLLIQLSDKSVPRERRHTFMAGPALASRKAVAAEVALMCARQTDALYMRLINFTPVRDGERMNREIRKNEARSTASRLQHEAKSRREAAASERRRLRTITVEEVDHAVRTGWADEQGRFNLWNSTFGRVRTLKCKRSGPLFECLVGVTALSSTRSPEYEEARMSFVRDATNKVEIYLDDIVL